MKKRAAFSLVELLIASAIFAVVMVSIYSAFRTGIFGYKNIQDNIETYQAARFILNRINSDLRNAFNYSTDKAEFSGSKEEMGFYSLVDTFYSGGVVKDYAFVSYELKGNKLMRSYFSNLDSIGELTGIITQELPGNVDSLGLSYAYLDKDKRAILWKDTWMDEQGAGTEEEKQLPIAVKIILKMKGASVEGFERTVFLPLGG